MERLTHKMPNGVVVPTQLNLDFVFDMADQDFAELQRIFDRLAAYEDKGLEPEEIMGPCEIGASAFVLESEDEDGGDDCIFEGNIVAIHIGTVGITVTIGHMEKKCWFSETERRVPDLNTDWYLTRAEAEAAQGGGGDG